MFAPPAAVRPAPPSPFVGTRPGIPGSTAIASGSGGSSCAMMSLSPLRIASPASPKAGAQAEICCLRAVTSLTRGGLEVTLSASLRRRSAVAAVCGASWRRLSAVDPGGGTRLRSAATVGSAVAVRGGLGTQRQYETAVRDGSVTRQLQAVRGGCGTRRLQYTAAADCGGLQL